MLEIEIKAHVEAPTALRERLAAALVSEGLSRKLDRYYCEAEVATEDLDPKRHKIARLRRLEGPDGAAEVILTVKRRQLVDGVELNTEREVAVADIDAAAGVLEALGFRLFISKDKTSDSFTDPDQPGLTFELNEIAHLGAFLEVEQLAPEGIPTAEVERLKASLCGHLQRFGVPESAIERRAYIQMLWGRGAGLAPEA